MHSLIDSIVFVFYHKLALRNTITQQISSNTIKKFLSAFTFI